MLPSDQRATIRPACPPPHRSASTGTNTPWLGVAWTLKKRDHVAQCVLFSHQFGWELRLEVGALFRTQVCRSSEEILNTQESWKAAMIEKGWAG